MSSIVLITLAVIFASFVCSIAESTILSLPQTYIAGMIKKGSKAGKILEKQKDNIDSALAAVLTVNTIANTLGGAAVASELRDLYNSNVVAAGSFVLCLVILVFAEIIPKTIGATYCRQLAPFAAYSIQFLTLITLPFVYLSRKISKLIRKEDDSGVLSREEMIMAAEMGADEGVIHAKESKIIKNLLNLDKIFVKDIMTPRSVLLAYQKDLKISDMFTKNKSVRFSRLPVYNRDLDDIVGIVLRYQILDLYSKDKEHQTLESIMNPVRTVSPNTSVSNILDEFIKQKEHMFVVVDEYGSTAGLVTLEDAIETLLGVEIVDEFDTVDDMRQFALEQWEKRRKWVLKSQS